MFMARLLVLSCATVGAAIGASALATGCSGRENAGSSAQRGASSTDTAVAARGANGVGPRVRASEGTSYVGLQYDSLPADFKFEGGSMVPAPATGPRAEYDFSHVSTPRGDMVWLDTIGAAVGRGLRARIVRGELTIPPLAADERLFMASCDVAGRFDSRVVAIVVNEPNTSRFTKIRQAWRVNLASGRFDIIPVTGVVCEEPGAG
jgi:hypothetical protein